MPTQFNDAPTGAIGATPEPQKGAPADAQGEPNAELATWVMERVNRWRSVRDTAYLTKWDEYYRMWRGMWAPEDKNRTSERSRLIMPALAQSVDLTHAEIVEAVFGRDRWFDLPDDLEDPNKEDMEKARDQLAEDLALSGVPDQLIKCLQIGTLYGTGAVKLSAEEQDIVVIGDDGAETSRKEAVVRVYPIDVRELVPDPSADNIDDMLGIAHEMLVPYHDVRAKQLSKFYFEASVGRVAPSQPNLPMGVELAALEDAVLVTEYHGKVPQVMLDRLYGIESDLDEDVLVEAVVTVGNFGILLRAKRNIIWGGDRSIVAYQHETVPGEFWGRGVAEKGYNPQKGLDAETRMRIDCMALVSAPMVAGDITRLPRGFDMRIFPGKNWPTTGDPREVLMPFNFGQLNPATFQQTSELERMVTVGTGAADVGQSLSQGSRRDTAAGTAMMASGFVKRSKRTMYNIEHQLLQPLLQKVLRRYMQFANKYLLDLKFTVKGAMGLMAREYEQGLMSQLYQSTTPEDGPVRLMVLREIFNMSSSPNKLALTGAIDQMLQPPDERAQQRQQFIEELQLRRLIAETNEIENKALNQGAQAAEHAAKAQGTVLEGSLKDEELTLKVLQTRIQAQEAAAYAAQVAIQSEDKRRADSLKSRSLDIQERKLTQQSK